MSLPPGTPLGPYQVVSLLGAGGMGEVYRARDERLGRDVAIKVLPAEVTADPDRLARFEREARAAAALDHPNILAVYDVGRSGRQPYLVTQLLEGKTLREAIELGPLSARKAAEHGIQIARGLAAAHERGIVHRDLKPGNVFVTKDGVVKILDFGLARLTHVEPGTSDRATDSTETELTGARAILGTVGYLAPEQVRGQPADHRADIFAFGCVLYEMLAGRRAFSKNSTVETLGAILHEDPPPLEASGWRVSPALVSVVQRCLEKRPEDRFQSAHDVAFAIEALAPGASGVPLRTLRRPWRRGRWAALAASCVVVGLAIVGLRWFSGRDALPDFEPRQVTSRPGLEGEPAVSPSGQEIAYVGREGERSDIWVVDARGGQSLRLTADGLANRSPTWFPDGSALVYVSERHGGSSVWKVPRLGGSPVLVVAGAEDPAISPDGARIAFSRPDAAGLLRIMVAALDAPQRATALTGDDDGLWHHRRPAWSPDGTTICYYDQNDLWLIPAKGGEARRLTADDEPDYDPTWSSSGRWVYFASDRQQTHAIWRAALRGGELSRVTMGTGQERWPTVTRAGDRLAYSTFAERTIVELIDTSTYERAEFEMGRQLYKPSIAPDRGSLLFTSNVEGSFDLWLLPLHSNRPAGEPVRLTEQSGSCAEPAFSPDGRWIAFHRVSGGQRDVWIMPAGGGAAGNFTAHPAVDVSPVWSPDGHWLAFVSDRSGVDQVWVAPVREGERVGEPRRIAVSARAVLSPTWSPDGTRIGLVETTGSESDVWTVAADGSEPPRRLTQGAEAWFVVWSRSSGDLLVLGTWGSRQFSIRAVPPVGGRPRELPFAVPSESAATLLGFDMSCDGKLLALFESSARGDVWVLEAKGRWF